MSEVKLKQLHRALGHRVLHSGVHDFGRRVRVSAFRGKIQGCPKP